MKKEKIILVGTGDYYHKILGPSLLLLEKEGLVELRATVSTSPKVHMRSIEHRIRKPNEKLSSLLSDLKKWDPIIILGHTNQLHTPDAQNLLQNNFRTFLEKPYAIDMHQLHTLQKIVLRYPNAIVFLEYYLMMKTIPLLILCGKVRTDGFYFEKKNLFHTYDYSLRALSGRIATYVGKPTFVLVDVLEGEGDGGRVEHRGQGLSDVRMGGGMIQDLGLHAVTPLFAIEDYIGKIDESFRDGNIRTARCENYVRAIKKKFDLPDRRIAESYAEIQCTTKTGVPILISIGKYLPHNRNQRRIVIVGTEGRVYFDLSSCRLYIARGEGHEELIMEYPKKPESKYCPIITAALRILNKENPFTFDHSNVILRAQRFIFAVQKKSFLKNHNIYYKKGAHPHTIFS